MDGRVPAGQAPDQSDLGTQRAVAAGRGAQPARPCGKPGRRPEARPTPPSPADQFKLTVNHFFPEFNGWLAALPDRRNPRLITYPVPHLVWEALLLLYVATENVIASGGRGCHHLA